MCFRLPSSLIAKVAPSCSFLWMTPVIVTVIQVRLLTEKGDRVMVRGAGKRLLKNTVIDDISFGLKIVENRVQRI